MSIDVPAAPLTELKPTLPGHLVLLRPPTREDGHVLAAMRADPELLRHAALVGATRHARECPPLALSALLDWYADRAAQADRLDLVVLDRDTGGVVGEVVLDGWDAEARAVGLRVALGPADRRRGLGTEAVRLVLAHAFEALDLNRVELVVLADDVPALRLAAKVGLVLEGTRREGFWFDGTPVDQHVMAVLRSDWLAHRGRPVVA